MPRHAFSLASRTLSRGVGVRYIHLPPRILPVSIPQSRRTKLLPITPIIIVKGGGYMNGRRAYCDDLSGNSSFSGNWANDFYDFDNTTTTTSGNSTSQPPMSAPPASFWSKLPDYTSTIQSTSQEANTKETTSPSQSSQSSKSSFSDEALEMINKTAAITATALNSSRNKFTTQAPEEQEETSHIIQKTVGEITKHMKFPDPDVWADTPDSMDKNTTTNYTQELATTDSTVSMIGARKI
ncbi:hypothetical protein TWF192_004446 [Orbilia oligospora]|uniref:Uncharacterized protein n=1 Tax=Orbilia oligospora TaxID=2813651 RepID=A0A6G1MCG1_ORBOL|nr:hypothetical protein TWF191_002123 [Orbilia oligospora]KAF3252645.1 hypothetical protein TWF192_004446 [Orbilia oligospora]